MGLHEHPRKTDIRNVRSKFQSERFIRPMSLIDFELSHLGLIPTRKVTEDGTVIIRLENNRNTEGTLAKPFETEIDIFDKKKPVIEIDELATHLTRDQLTVVLAYLEVISNVAHMIGDNTTLLSDIAFSHMFKEACVKYEGIIRELKKKNVL